MISGQVVNFPSNIPNPGRRKKPNPEIQAVIDKLLKLPEGKAMKYHMERWFQQRTFIRRVRVRMSQIGWHMEARTDGMGHIYMRRTKPYAS